MAEKPHPSQPGESPDPSAARRALGHRGDVRDTVAELAERAQAISQEAGTKVSAAMKDVMNAAAGIAGFAIESARDLVQYMVRRGQMTPEEGDRLIREAEATHEKRWPSEKAKTTATKVAAERAAAAKAETAARAAAAHAAPYARPIGKTPAASQASVAKSGTAPIAAQKSAHLPTKAAAKPSAVKAKAAKPLKAEKPGKGGAPTKDTKKKK